MHLALTYAFTLGLVVMGAGAPALAQEKPSAATPAYYVADFAVTDREGIKPGSYWLPGC